MGLPVYREPSAAEPQNKPDDTSASRSTIRRQPNVRSSRRVTHLDPDSAPLLSLWHGVSRSGTVSHQVLRDRFHNRQGSRRSSGVPNRHLDARPSSRRGPSASNPIETSSRRPMQDGLEHMPPLRRMSGRNIANELPPRRAEQETGSDPNTHQLASLSAGMDGLGDRRRSMSSISSLSSFPEESAEPWSNMAVTIIPDETLPSASTSFASGAGAGNSFRERSRQRRSVPSSQGNMQQRDAYSQTEGILPGDDFTTMSSSHSNGIFTLVDSETSTEEDAPRRDPIWESDWSDWFDDSALLDAAQQLTDSEQEGNGANGVVVERMDGSSTNSRIGPRFARLPSQNSAIARQTGIHFEHEATQDRRLPTQASAVGHEPADDASSHPELRQAIRQECETLQAQLHSFISESSNEDSLLTEGELVRMQGELRQLRRTFLQTRHRSRQRSRANPRSRHSARAMSPDSQLPRPVRDGTRRVISGRVEPSRRTGTPAPISNVRQGQRGPTTQAAE